MMVLKLLNIANRIQIQNKPTASLSFVHSKHRVSVANLLHHLPELHHIVQFWCSQLMIFTQTPLLAYHPD